MNKKQFKAGFRLHWLSWLTLLLLSACLTVIVIPGVVVPANDEVMVKQWQLPATSKLGWGLLLSHGWPYEYMQSDLNSFDATSDVIAWTTRDAWAVGNKVFSFNLKSLMVDLLVAGMIVAVGTLAVEFWRRRRKGTWFSLLDMFVGIALIAIVAAWYQSHASDRVAEWTALGIENRKSDSLRVTSRHQAPDWLTRLVGGKKQIPFCEHFTEVSISAIRTQEHHSDEVRSRQQMAFLRAVAGFKRVEAIVFHGPGVLHPELPNAVASLKRLDKLLVNYDKHHMRIESSANYYDPVPVFETMSQVSDRTVYSSHKGICYQNFLRESIDQKVRSLETLQKLDRLEQLATLEVNFGYISHVGWRAIPPLTKLSKISFASREIFIEDLVVLEQFTDLKQVWLSISATKQELENFQRTHPQLQLTWDARSELTSNQVVDRRLKNLRLEEWYAGKSPNFYWRFDEKLDPLYYQPNRVNGILRKLDLTEFTLTPQRLEVVGANVDVESVLSLSVNRIDSVQTLNQFLKRCSSLKKLELHSEFPNELIFQLNLPKQLSFAFCRGDLTVEDLHRLIEKHQFYRIYIYDSTLSDAQYTAFEEAWPDIIISNSDSVPSEFQPEKEPRNWPGGLGGR